MPFVRFSRDKRGYECVYLVDVPSRQSRTARPHVLYWYRTPPGVRVGREPFDAGVRQALEARYPRLKFDWKQIIDTPAPPVSEVPRWRERRMLERAAKRAGRADAAEADIPTDGAAVSGGKAFGDVTTGEGGGPAIASEAGAVSPNGETASPGGSPARRKRRRGGRGRRRGGERAAGDTGTPVAVPGSVAANAEQSTAAGSDD